MLPPVCMSMHTKNALTKAELILSLSIICRYWLRWHSGFCRRRAVWPLLSERPLCTTVSQREKKEEFSGLDSLCEECASSGRIIFYQNRELLLLALLLLMGWWNWYQRNRLEKYNIHTFPFFIAGKKVEKLFFMSQKSHSVIFEQRYIFL